MSKAKITRKIIFGLVLFIAVILFCIIYSATRTPFSTKSIQHTGTVYGVSTYTESLEILPTRISTTFDKYAMEFELDLSDSKVLAFENYDGYSYVAYSTTDDSIVTEIIVTSELDESLELTEEEQATLAKSNIAFRNVSKTEDGILLDKSGINYYNKVYVFVIQQMISDKDTEKYTEVELKDLVDIEVDDDTYSIRLLGAIIDCAYYSQPEVNNIYMEIDGVSVVNLNDLEILENSAGVSSNSSNEISIYNTKTGEKLLTISDVTKFKDKIVQAEGWNNLYYSVNKDIEDNEEYKLFGIRTTKGFYSIQPAENAPDSLEEDFLSLIGIKPDDTKVEFGDIEDNTETENTESTESIESIENTEGETNIDTELEVNEQSN